MYARSDARHLLALRLAVLGRSVAPPIRLQAHTLAIPCTVWHDWRPARCRWISFRIRLSAWAYARKTSKSSSRTAGKEANRAAVEVERVKTLGDHTAWATAEIANLSASKSDPVDTPAAGEIVSGGLSVPIHQVHLRSR